MTCSYNVFLPNGQTIGVSDDAAGNERLQEILQRHGNCKVDCYDRNDIWGKGYDGVEPMCTLTVQEILEG